MARLLLAFTLPLIGCGSTSPPETVVDADTDSACEACLARGGTWQPEVRQCTRDCTLQDISCFRDACPGPCSRAACGVCFSSESCAAAGCLWVSEAEAMWCRDP